MYTQECRNLTNRVPKSAWCSLTLKKPENVFIYEQLQCNTILMSNVYTVYFSTQTYSEF